MVHVSKNENLASSTANHGLQFRHVLMRLQAKRGGSRFMIRGNHDACPLPLRDQASTGCRRYVIALAGATGADRGCFVNSPTSATLFG
jgi:hypothetical protein